jgi:tetratricopeptide (TPR) repeat protein
MPCRVWVVLCCSGILTVTSVLATAAPPVGQAKPQRERVQQLVKQLGDADYFVRQRAQDELAEIGIDAFDALSEAEGSDDLEIADRARYLIRLLHVAWSVESDPPELRRAMRTYEGADDKERADLIESLHELPRDEGLTGLCRIVRFERSERLAKLAGLQIIDLKPDEMQQAARDTKIRAALGRSPRPAAQWLRAFLATQTTPPPEPLATATAWGRLAAAETSLFEQAPQQSLVKLVVGLRRLQVAALEQGQRHDEALAVMRTMISLEPEDNDALGELITWLAEQQAWSVIDEASQRFAARFDQDPLLLYTLAEARQAQGNRELKEQAVERALRASGENQRQHLIVAIKLQQRGSFEWSEREYRRVVEIGPAEQPDTLRALWFLSEMLHDQEKDGLAAETQGEAARLMENRPRIGANFDELDNSLEATKARMHFFRACHEAQQGHLDKQREELLKAIEVDRTDADSLIALYRMKDAPAALRERTVRLIEEAAKKFHEDMERSPDEPTPFNQYAWLVGNTEGDMAEALRASLKSLELKPNTAGYLDTLGRCYFANGDLENALKYQNQAVKLDPHSSQMRKQLEQFRTAKAKADAQQESKPAGDAKS